MFGSAPDALLLVCDVKRRRIETFDTPVLGYRELIRMHEALCGTVKPARAIGMALNTHGLAGDEARAEIERARRETGLPADDVVRNGAASLWDAIAPHLHKTRPLAEVQ